MDFVGMDFMAIALASFVSFMFVTVLFLISRFRRCPSNKILAVYGKLKGGQSVKCYHGGGAFVWPLIQGSTYLDLTPMTISIPLRGALSLQNIRINVPSTFTIAISTMPEIMNNAAVRILGLDSEEVKSMASEIIFGQLRLAVASLSIEEINQDRERFLEVIRHNIEQELKKIGLELINVNITDIHDESGYIDSIGKKAASAAVNQAKIDVAVQEKLGEIGKTEAERERRIQVATFNAQAVEGENKAKASVAQFEADLSVKEAEADQRSEVAQQYAEVEIQKAKALSEVKRLEAEEIVPREIDKRKVEIAAEAAAQKQRKEASGQADSILLVKQAEAEGIQKVLLAKSEGYKTLVQACKSNAKDVATLLLVEKLEHIVALQTEAIKNIKIDKITVWDSGDGKSGSSTANFMNGMIKSLPPLHDVAAMAGIELPEYLGNAKGKETVQEQEPVNVQKAQG